MTNILYKLTYGFLWLISLLPLPVLYLFSDFIYLFVGPLFGYRRKVIRENLKNSFPEKSEKELRKIEKGFYHYLCDNAVENVKQLSMSKKQMMRRMQFKNVEMLREGFKDHQFTWLYLAHYGSWEWIASLQYWLDMAKTCQVYHPLRNDVFDRLYTHLREQYGGESIPMKQTLRRILEMRKEGTKAVIGLLSDQLPKWNGIHHFTPFLHRESAVYTGAEQMGKKIGGMMVYGRMRRVKRGYYECELVKMTFEPKKFKDFELTDQYMHLLEEDIKRQPEIWLWSHKRWRRTKEQWLERQKKADEKSQE